MRQQLRIAPDRRERGPQLVRRVGHETALGFQRPGQALIGRLELLQHPVEALAEDADFVWSRVLREAPFQVVGAGDRLRGLRHSLQRLERAARDQPARQKRRQQGGD